MLEKLAQHQKATHDGLASGNLNQRPLNRAEWHAMCQMMPALKLFLEATESLSAGDALLRQVVLVVRELQNRMETLQGISVPGWGKSLSPAMQAQVRWLKEGIRKELDPSGSTYAPYAGHHV